METDLNYLRRYVAIHEMLISGGCTQKDADYLLSSLNEELGDQVSDGIRRDAIMLLPNDDRPAWRSSALNC